MNNGLSTGPGAAGVGTRAVRKRMRRNSALSRSAGIGMGTNRMATAESKQNGTAFT